MSLEVKSPPIYLDYNATTPVDAEVANSMLPFIMEHFGNPSSRHFYGRNAATALISARERVASLLGVGTEDIIFTGSGSEANNLALRSAIVAAATKNRNHIVTQVTEHPSVLETSRCLSRLHGMRITCLPVDKDGHVSLEVLRQAVTEKTAIVSIQHANGETGTVQPVAAMSELAHNMGALMHTDASQTVGKIPVDVRALGVDFLTVTGHKFYGPKGVGALYAPSRMRLDPLINGGGQERGRRSGTENTAAIVGLGTACVRAAAELHREPQRLEALREALHAQLRQAMPSRVHLNGHTSQRLPNTLNVSLDGFDDMAAFLEQNDHIAASTASACHSGRRFPSYVLTAMGIEPDRALSAVRLAAGRWTTEDDINTAARCLAAAAGAR